MGMGKGPINGIGNNSTAKTPVTPITPGNLAGMKPGSIDPMDPVGMAQLQMAMKDQRSPEVKAGLNAPDDGGALPGPEAAPNPNTNATILPPEPPAPLPDVALKAMRSVVLAARRDRELYAGPIGAKNPMAEGGGNNGKDPWMIM
jgi:hypothetical protein